VKLFFAAALISALALLSWACAGRAGEGRAAAAGEAVSPEEAVTETPVRQISEPRAALLPDALRLGDPFAVVLALPEDREGLYAVLLSPRGRRLCRAAFFTLEEDAGGAVLKAAFLAVPTLAASGEGRVMVEGPSLPEGLGEGLPLIIAERDFPTETITLNRRNTAIRAEPAPQKNTEAEGLWAILNSAGTDVFAEGVFIPPLESTRRTSEFGDRRVYRYDTGASDTSVHAGIDYGVPSGTRVGACAAGRVVFAGERIVTGNSVILEHLPGVYSLYYHLDSIALEAGAMVEAGDTLGESGATGLATGPHLHWEIRAAGENADPDAFTAKPLLDRAAIHEVLSW
jgi:murein DD-endopeptidase MepM/ murein hydrolase activator NlpD